MPQVRALQVLGGNKSASMASMWAQAWEVVCVDFFAYQKDQGRDVPLMAKRRFTSMPAKDLPKPYMKQLLADVRPARVHELLDTESTNTHLHVAMSDLVPCV